MQTNLIIVSEYCTKCQVEQSFIKLLSEEGLIDVLLVEDQEYIQITQLPELERYVRWHYDLSINIEGIDAIRNLLYQMAEMKAEITRLKQLVSAHKENP